MNKKAIKDGGGDQGPPGKDMPAKINPEIKAILERVMERAGEGVQTEAVKQAAEARENVAPGGKFPPVQEKPSGVRSRIHTFLFPSALFPHQSNGL